MLIRSAVERGELTRDEITRELCVTAEQTDGFVDGTRVLSPAHQLCLALILIERVPRLARQGHALRAQVAATMAFAAQQTRVHSQAPATWRTLKQGPSGRPRRS